jgi:integrase
MSKALTAIAIAKLKPKAKRYEVPDPGQRGHYIVVFPSGKKSNIARFRFDRVKWKMSFGDVGLAAGRKLVADAMFEVAQGRNPALAKKAAQRKAANAGANTVQAVCERYLAQEGKKLRTAADRQATLERLVYPEIGRLPIDSLRRGAIVELLDKIEANSGPVMADRTLAIIRKILNWYAVRNEDFRTPIVKGMTRAKQNGGGRARVLDDGELRKIWAAAGGEGEAPFPALVKFLLLTGARRSEAAEMTWGEIRDGDWELPAQRNKTGLDFVRPLSKAAQAILQAQLRFEGCPYVFTTDGKHPLSGFSKFKAEFDERCGVTGWTLHDCRRSARSWMSRAGISADIAEIALGHVLPGVRKVYDRHTYYGEKGRAFEALATLIGRIVNPTDNVTSMHRKSR